jgi:hypothetical protein
VDGDDGLDEDDKPTEEDLEMQALLDEIADDDPIFDDDGDAEPNKLPAVPEPLHFDLVRGMNAERGELEVNSLFVMPGRRGRPWVEWAPEIEYAILDGFALEFELPMVDDEVHALKLAVQARLWARDNRMHGLQAIREDMIQHPGAESSLLWLSAWAMGRHWSLLGMAGGRYFQEHQADNGAAALVNLSVFREIGERAVVGLETNLMAGHHDPFVLLAPQWHQAIAHDLKIQLGVGAQLDGGAWAPAGLLRFIVEREPPRHRTGHP